MRTETEKVLRDLSEDLRGELAAWKTCLKNGEYTQGYCYGRIESLKVVISMIENKTL